MTKYFESTRTGEFIRSTSPGFGESFNFHTGQWQRTFTLDHASAGLENDVESVTEADARDRWAEAFEPAP